MKSRRIKHCRYDCGYFTPPVDVPLDPLASCFSHFTCHTYTEYTETNRIYRNTQNIQKLAEWRNNVSSAKIFKSISRLDEESQTLNYEFRLKSNSCWQILSELMFEISEIDSGMLLFKNAFRLRHLRDTR